MIARLLALGLLAWMLASGVAKAAQNPPSASSEARVLAPASAPGSVPAGADAAVQAPLQVGSAVPASSFFQTMFGLVLVLGVLLALAWGLKRFGPKGLQNPKHIKLVGGLSLGGRERVAVLEVAGTWIVVGSAPGRVTTLATLPKPADASEFEDVMKHTLKERHEGA